MSSKSLQITVGPGTTEGTRILRLNGPLNMETTLEFLKVARAESCPVLIVEFGDFPYMDSAGLGAVIGVYVGGIYQHLSGPERLCRPATRSFTFPNKRRSPSHMTKIETRSKRLLRGSCSLRKGA
jgi:hypothetical protein